MKKPNVEWFELSEEFKPRKIKGRTHLESSRRRKLKAEVKKLGGKLRKLKFIEANGAPDEIVLMPGAHYLVELKQDGKEPEEHQLLIHEELRTAGFYVGVINSEDSFNNFIQRIRDANSNTKAVAR